MEGEKEEGGQDKEGGGLVAGSDGGVERGRGRRRKDPPKDPLPGSKAKNEDGEEGGDDGKPWTLHPEPQTLNPKPSHLNPKPLTTNHKPQTPNH